MGKSSKMKGKVDRATACQLSMKSRDSEDRIHEIRLDESEDNYSFVQQDVKEKKTEAVVRNEILKLRASKKYFDVKNKENVKPKQPINFETEYIISNADYELEDTEVTEEPVAVREIKPSKFALKVPVPAQGPGVINYHLSDAEFINKGWTSLPTQKIFRKMCIFRIHHTSSLFDWFEYHKGQSLYYETGEDLATVDEDGCGKWHYRNGNVALKLYYAEEPNVEKRTVVYSSGEPEYEGGPRRPITVLASFDYLGNGIFFDHVGNIRMKYNQTEGVVFDKNIGPYTHWKWHDLNEPAVYEHVFVESQLTIDEAIKNLSQGNSDPDRHEIWMDSEALKAELYALQKQGSNKEKRYIPFSIKIKGFKINENFSIRIIDQSNIKLSFSCGTTSLKLSLGLKLDPNEIVDCACYEVDDWTQNLSSFEMPPKTESLELLQKDIKIRKILEKRRLDTRAALGLLPQPQRSASRLLSRGTTGLSSRTSKMSIAVPSSVVCSCKLPDITNFK